MSLVLVEEKEVDKKIQPEVTKEGGAMRYLDIKSVTTFHELVVKAQIPYAMHANGKRRIYRRSDLDRYLDSLNWRTMSRRENSPKPILKGVGK